MVVVTGGAGFIGARLVEALRGRGIPVASVDRLDAFDSRQEHKGIDFGERVDMTGLAEWLADRRGRLRAIVHLGACTDTRQTDRALLARVNVQSSQALWREAAATDVPFIYASSAATFGDGALGFDDDEELIARLQPLNPYAQSKQDFDLWVLEADRQGPRPPAWTGLKFFNVYGFGERHKGPMASVALQAFDQIRATGGLRLFRSHRPDVSDGEQARDFVYVGEVVDILVGLIDQPLRRGIFNVGSGTARTFRELAHMVFHALGRSPVIEYIDMPVELRARYQYRTEARMARLRQTGLARHPVPLETGVDEYVRRLLDAASP